MSTAPLNLWLADRSRYETGTGHCQRARYLGYHAGPHGYGWAPRAQSVPLVTGIMLAEIQEWLHGYVLATSPQSLPSEEAYYTEAILPAKQRYQKVVNERGLSNVVGEEELLTRTLEQLTLLEGLAWTWFFIGLPQLMAEWNILTVEQEELSVLGCTCGLGDRLGTAAEHDARECQGIGYMTRGDLVCQHKVIPNRFSYHEFKAPGETNINTDAAWNYRVQILSGVVGAEDRLHIRIDEILLHQSIKGKRQSAWDAEQGKAVGPKFQNSSLVYAWKRPANLPLVPEDWQINFKYVDELGKNRKLTRDYERAPIWEVAWQGSGALSASHYWVKWIGADELAKHYRLLGPLQRTEERLGQYLRQLVGEERRWQAVLWDLYESGQWGEDDYMAKLDARVPQNRGQACHSYYGEPCAFLKLCDRVDGWQSPELLNYLPRRPHHVPELEQAIGRGLIAPDEGLVDQIES